MATVEYPAPLAAFIDQLTSLLPLDEMRTVLADLEEARRELDEQIEHLRGVIASLSSGNGRKYPPKRQAVLELMREHPARDMRLSDIRAELIRRGNLPNTKNAGHALQMTMVNLVKRGTVDRVRPGVYLLNEPLIPAESAFDLSAFPTQAEAFASPDRAHGGMDARFATPDLQRKEGEA